MGMGRIMRGPCCSASAPSVCKDHLSKASGLGLRDSIASMLAKNIFYLVIISVFTLSSAHHRTEDAGTLGEGALVSFTPY